MSIGRRVDRPEKAIVELAGLTRERQAEEEAGRVAWERERAEREARCQAEWYSIDNSIWWGGD